MENDFNTKHSTGFQFLILIGLFVFAFIIGQIISMLFIYFQFGEAGFDDLTAIMQKSNNGLYMVRLAQIVSSIFIFGFPALVFSKLQTKSYFAYSNLHNPFVVWTIILIPFLLISIYPIINISYFFNQSFPFPKSWATIFRTMEDDSALAIAALLRDISPLAIFTNFIMIAILPAIFEEWFFRGTVQPFFTKKMNVHLAIFFTAIFFSFIHFQFYGFFPRLILGMLLGYIFYYSGSLWLSIFMHFINNGAQVIMIILYNKQLISGNPDKPQMPDTLQTIGYSIAFVFTMLLFIKSNNKKNISL